MKLKTVGIIAVIVIIAGVVGIVGYSIGNRGSETAATVIPEMTTTEVTTTEEETTEEYVGPTVSIPEVETQGEIYMSDFQVRVLTTGYGKELGLDENNIIVLEVLDDGENYRVRFSENGSSDVYYIDVKHDFTLNKRGKEE